MLNIIFQYFAIYIFLGWLFNLLCEFKLYYDLRFNIKRQLEHEYSQYCVDKVLADTKKNLYIWSLSNLLWPIGLILFSIIDCMNWRVLVEMRIHTEKEIDSRKYKCKHCEKILLLKNIE